MNSCDSRAERPLLPQFSSAAAQLGVSRAKLYELIAAGKLPAVKVGGCRRIRAADLRDFVDHLSERQPSS